MFMDVAIVDDRVLFAKLMEELTVSGMAIADDKDLIAQMMDVFAVFLKKMAGHTPFFAIKFNKFNHDLLSKNGMPMAVQRCGKDNP